MENTCRFSKDNMKNEMMFVERYAKNETTFSKEVQRKKYEGDVRSKNEIFNDKYAKNRMMFIEKCASNDSRPS